jgi:hypothetical protein
VSLLNMHWLSANGKLPNVGVAVLERRSTGDDRIASLPAREPDERCRAFEARRFTSRMTCGKRELNGASQAANGHMYLGTQATARAADRLIFRPLFSPRRRVDAPGRWWSR